MWRGASAKSATARPLPCSAQTVVHLWDANPVRADHQGRSHELVDGRRPAHLARRGRTMAANRRRIVRRQGVH